MQHQCPEACVGIVGGSADDLSDSTVLRHKGQFTFCWEGLSVAVPQASKRGITSGAVAVDANLARHDSNDLLLPCCF